MVKWRNVTKKIKSSPLILYTLDHRVNNLSRLLVLKTSLEKIIFASQDDLSFSRLTLKTKGPVLKTKRHIVLIALLNLSLVFKTTCAV